MAIEPYFEDQSGIWLWLKDHVVTREHAEIKRLYVRESYRGSGAADALFDALEAHARALTYRRLYLDTRKKLAPALCFFERRGYRNCERYYPQTPVVPPPADILYMCKDVDLG
jgi:GNAT superfamily N-acetyltransferase